MGHWKHRPLWLGRQVVTKDFAEQSTEGRVETVGHEPVAVTFALPHIHIPQTAFGALQRQVHDKARWYVRAEHLHQPAMKYGIDRHILSERIRHGLLTNLCEPESI